MGAHCAPAILRQVGADPLLVTQQGSHLATTAVLLVGPGLVLWAMDAAARRLLGERILQNLCSHVALAHVKPRVLHLAALVMAT